MPTLKHEFSIGQQVKVKRFPGTEKQLQEQGDHLRKTRGRVGVIQAVLIEAHASSQLVSYQVDTSAEELDLVPRMGEFYHLNWIREAELEPVG